MSSTFDEVVEDYLQKFNDTPTVWGLTLQQREKAVDVMEKAIENDKPLTDAEFFKAIGVEMYGKDELV